MVKTLAPALLAELAKLEATPSTSYRGSIGATFSASASSSAANKRPVAAKTTFGQQKASSAKTKVRCTGLRNGGTVSFLTTHFALVAVAQPVKASVPTIVTLGKIHRSLTYLEIVAAVEHYGKTKSVVVFRSKGEVTFFVVFLPNTLEGIHNELRCHVECSLVLPSWRCVHCACGCVRAGNRVF